ncbi:hypothetical protein IQ07DRAFT_651101 [Pyrenochaeta sp. DS3sAY3a]|nr:hypothetical protein IQ07DRAFT_651101 [Pyrenochaeta sp. DS3sAY3a]
MHVDAAEEIISEEIISDVGYAGVQAGRNIVPRICPFCYHDENLPDHERITAYTREVHVQHIGDHVKQIKNRKPVRQCPCYPSTCTKAGTMDATQLTTHLAVVHGIDVPNRSTEDASTSHQPSRSSVSARNKFCGTAITHVYV